MSFRGYETNVIRIKKLEKLVNQYYHVRASKKLDLMRKIESFLGRRNIEIEFNIKHDQFHGKNLSPYVWYTVQENISKPNSGFREYSHVHLGYLKYTRQQKRERRIADAVRKLKILDSENRKSLRSRISLTRELVSLN